VAIVLPVVDAFQDDASIESVSLAALSRSLLRALLGTAPLGDVRAIRAYICGTLLGQERVPAPQAAWGLCLLASRPSIRASVDRVLEACGLCAYRDLIDVQLWRAGLR